MHQHRENMFGQCGNNLSTSQSGGGGGGGGGISHPTYHHPHLPTRTCLHASLYVFTLHTPLQAVLLLRLAYRGVGGGAFPAAVRVPTPFYSDYLALRLR